MAGQLWYPEAIRDEFPSAGSFTGGPKKGCIHTAEGKTYASARSVYVNKHVPPQFTCTFENRKFEIYQHMPANRAGKALVNATGGVQTNLDGVIQMEIICCADGAKAVQIGAYYVGGLPQEFLDGIARWMRWVELEHGVVRKAPQFKPYPASYGNNGVRFSNAIWDNWDGWCGHMHVPENVHGDPGEINIAYLLGQVAPPQEEEEDMGKFVTSDKGTVWVTNGITSRWVRDEAEFWDLVAIGIKDTGKNLPYYDIQRTKVEGPLPPTW